MSTTHPVTLHCPSCEASQRVLMPESANVQRSPSWRTQVLDGTLNRFACEACGAVFVVERDLLYTDLDRGVFIGVFARARRGEVAELSETIRRTFEEVVGTEAPRAVRESFPETRPRVVFGYAELREKVVCFDHGLDDRVVEAIKLALLEGIPGAAAARVSGLVLVEVQEDGGLVLAPVGGDRPFGDRPFVVAPPAMVAEMHARAEHLAVLLPSLFNGPYVNLGSPPSPSSA
ncbi:MAG: CpXC domain-containing protein [Deltaproteobacteria bacterium]|nr:CpXC domain-containing protein [Deltaproteobacteria bacterium]